MQTLDPDEIESIQTHAVDSFASECIDLAIEALDNAIEHRASQATIAAYRAHLVFVEQFFNVPAIRCETRP